MNSEMENDNILVSPGAFCVEGDNVYIMHAKVCIIIKYNLKTGFTEMIDLTKFADENAGLQFCRIHIYKEKLYIVPYWNRRILCYDLKLKKAAVVNESNSTGRFSASFLINGILYCIPYYEKNLLRIELDTMTISCIEWRNLGYGPNVNINFAFEREGKIYCLVSQEQNPVMILQNDQLKVALVQVQNEKFSSGCSFLGKIYLYSPVSKNVYVFENIEKEPSHVIPMIEGGGIIQAIGNQYLLLENTIGDNSIWIDSYGNKEYITEKNNRDSLNYSYYHGLVAQDEGRYFYYNRRENSLCEYKNGKLLDKYFIYFSKEKAKDYMSKGTIENEVIAESAFWGLQEWIEKICAEKS